MVDKKIQIITAAIIVIAVIGIIAIGIAGKENKTTNQEQVIKGENVKNASIQKEVVTLKAGGYQLPTNGIIAPAIAEELGYYEGKIKIENANTPNDAVTLTAIAKGELDFGHVTGVAIVRAVAKGAKVKAVAAAHGPPKNNIYVLADGPIKNAKDLKGKRIGGSVITPGITSYIVLDEALQSLGVSIDEVELVNIPSSTFAQVLKTKQVDAVYGKDIQLGPLVESGEAKMLFSVDGQFSKDHPRYNWHHCGLVVSEKFIKEKPELLKVLVAGFIKGVDWERDNPEKAKELHIAKGTNIEKVQKYYEPTNIREHAFHIDQDYQLIIDDLIKSGELKEGQVKPSDFYTNEFNPYFKK